MKVRTDRKNDPVSELFVDVVDPGLCVREDGFFLHPEHLRRLRDIRRLRREIHPSGCIPAMGTLDEPTCPIFNN